MSSQFQDGQIPGMGSMNDPLGFVKKLWGDMQIPGMVTPAISIDELDKKIKDLKTVESWLTVNMNMLRGTIQAMEVQRATIATLKSMSESFSQQMGNPAGTSADAKTESKAKAQWPMPPAESVKESAEKPAEKPAEAAAQSATKPQAQAKTAAEAPAAAGNEFANPAAWWGLLQDQFKQAVSQAMETEPVVKKAAAAVKPNGATPKAAKKAPAKAGPATKKPAAKTPASKTAAAKKPAAKAGSKRLSP